MRRTPTVPEKILVVRTDRLGDVILTLPLVSALRRNFPRAHIALLLRRYTGSIVEGHRDVDEIVWCDDEGGNLPFFTLLSRLRRKRFHAAIAVYPRFRIAALLFLSGIPLRVGSGYRFYSVLFNHRVYEHRKDARRHELEYNLNLLRPLGIEPPEPGGKAEFGIVVSDVSAARVDAVLSAAGVAEGSAFVVLHPGTGKSAREWPRSQMAELGRRIGRDLRMPVVITGTEGEAGLVRGLAAEIGPFAIPLAGMLTLKELAALLRRATVWVGNSTGPLHLAVAVGTPVVGLYPQLRPMSARRWGPYTLRSRVHVPDKPEDCRECETDPDGICACMESITVDSVLTSVEAMRTLPREAR